MIAVRVTDHQQLDIGVVRNELFDLVERLHCSVAAVVDHVFRLAVFVRVRKREDAAEPGADVRDPDMDGFCLRRGGRGRRGKESNQCNEKSAHDNGPFKLVVGRGGSEGLSQCVPTGIL
jgi:hypothetical protein